MGKITEAKKTDRAAVMACLLAAKNKPEKASLYADSYLEYQEAQKTLPEMDQLLAIPGQGLQFQTHIWWSGTKHLPA